MSPKTKVDVDRYAEDVFRKCLSDHDKKLKSLVIGKLYLSVKAYDIAVRHFQAFLSVNENSPETYKLIGKCFQQLGKPEKAIVSYKRSLELEPPQPALVLLICELISSMNLADVGINSARHWYEKGSELFPNNAVITNLRQKIVIAENKDPKAVENFYLSELRSNPNDEILLINLLNLYVSSKQFAAAHKKIIEYQGNPALHQSLEWHRCLRKVYKLCLQDISSDQVNTGDFLLEAVAASDNHLSILHRFKNDGLLDEALSVLQSFDQLLSKLCSVSSLRGPVDKDIQRHYQAQLSFHIAVLTLKKLIKEEASEKDAKELVAPSLLLAQASPFDLESPHLSSLDSKYRAKMRYIVDDATFRLIQANLTLRNWFKGAAEDKIITSISNGYSNETRSRIFSKIFPQGEAGLSSCWLRSSVFEKLPQRLLSLSEVVTESNLFAYERRSAHSYHDLVWLGVQTLFLNVSPGNLVLPKIFKCQNFPSLPLSSQNLNLVSVESLSKLDADSFLYLSVFSSYLSLVESKAAWHESLLSDVIPSLATDKQLQFWAAVQKSRKGELGDSIDSKSILIKGVETVRLIGQHGLDLRLLILVARTFEAQARSAAKQQDALYTSAVEKRAFLFWSNIIRKLELAQVQDVYQSANAFFPHKFSPVKRNEIPVFLEEGRFFVAYKKMRSENYQEALEGFKSLSSAEAALHEALIYKRLALNEIRNQECDEITAEMHAKHNTWLMKAKEALCKAEERLGDQINHPLRSELGSLLEEIEGRLVRYDRDSRNEDETESLPSTVDSNIELDSSLYQPRSSFNSTSHDLDFRSKSGNFTPQRSSDAHSKAPNLKDLIASQTKMFNFLEQLSKRVEKIEQEVTLLVKNTKKTDQKLQRTLMHICSNSNPLFQTQLANLLLPQFLQAPSFYPQVVPPLMPHFLPPGMPSFIPPGMMPPVLVPPQPNLNVSQLPNSSLSHLLPGTSGVIPSYSIANSYTQSSGESTNPQISRPDSVTISGSPMPAPKLSSTSCGQQPPETGHIVKTNTFPVGNHVLPNNSSSSCNEQPVSSKQPLFKPSALTSVVTSQNQPLLSSSPTTLSILGPSVSQSQSQSTFKPSFMTTSATSVPFQSSQTAQPTGTSGLVPPLKPSTQKVIGSTLSQDMSPSVLSKSVLSSSSTVSSSNSPSSIKSPLPSDASFFNGVATPQGESTPVKLAPANGVLTAASAQKVSESLFNLLTKPSSAANSNPSISASAAYSSTELAGTTKSATPILSKPDNTPKSLLKETLLKSVDPSTKPTNLSFNSFESSPLSDRFSLEFAKLSKNCELNSKKSDSFKGFDGQGSKLFDSPASIKNSNGSPAGDSAKELMPTAEFQPVVALSLAKSPVPRYLHSPSL
nr:PREDICTED: RANBP2-like and GRIP domain-containing protein 2 [Bemisia tabaci]